MATKEEMRTELLVRINQKSQRIKKLKLECGQKSTKICVLNLRIKELETVIKTALRISDLWTLGEVENMFEDEAKALLLMKEGFERALKEL